MNRKVDKDDAYWARYNNFIKKVARSPKVKTADLGIFFDLLTYYYHPSAANNYQENCKVSEPMIGADRGCNKKTVERALGRLKKLKIISSRQTNVSGTNDYTCHWDWIDHTDKAVPRDKPVPSENLVLDKPVPAIDKPVSMPDKPVPPVGLDCPSDGQTSPLEGPRISPSTNNLSNESSKNQNNNSTNDSNNKPNLGQATRSSSLRSPLQLEPAKTTEESFNEAQAQKDMDVELKALIEAAYTKYRKLRPDHDLDQPGFTKILLMDNPIRVVRADLEVFLQSGSIPYCLDKAFNNGMVSLYD